MLIYPNRWLGRNISSNMKHWLSITTFPQECQKVNIQIAFFASSTIARLSCTPTWSLNGVQRRKNCHLPLPFWTTGSENILNYNSWPPKGIFLIDHNCIDIPYNFFHKHSWPHALASKVSLRDGAQLAKLVKAIFRPWNSYCIQVQLLSKLRKYKPYL